MKAIYHMPRRTLLQSFQTGERGNYIHDFLLLSDLIGRYTAEEIPAEAGEVLSRCAGGYGPEEPMGEKEFVRLVDRRFLSYQDRTYTLYEISV